MTIMALLLAVALHHLRERELFWVLAWPGTVLHEVCHWLVGLVLGAQPTQFSVFPQPRESGGRTHGYVEFANVVWFNAAPVALAPLLGLVLAFFMASHLSWQLTWSNLLIWWVCVSAFCQSWPSAQDWKVAVQSRAGLAFYGAILLGFIML
jgi:hypothetical protein